MRHPSAAPARHPTDAFTRAARVLLLAAGLSACTPSGDDWRNGQAEEHVDPGPGEIASTLGQDYAAAGGAETFRGVRVWPENGLWVYTERAAVGQPPVRTVYHVDYADRGGYVARVYAVPDRAPPLSREPGAAGPLSGLTPDDLAERHGCAVVFERTGPGDYDGATVGQRCPPSDPAASHAVTEIRLGDTVSVWVRDLDADGDRASGPAAPTVYVPTDR